MPAIAPALRLLESALRLLESDGLGFAEATGVLEEPDEVEEVLLDAGAESALSHSRKSTGRETNSSSQNL